MYRERTGEDEELVTQGCSPFPRTTGSVMEMFCSSSQQGWGVGEHQGPWENPVPCCAAEMGARGSLCGNLPC